MSSIAVHTADAFDLEADVLELVRIAIEDHLEMAATDLSDSYSIPSIDREEAIAVAQEALRLRAALTGPGPYRASDVRDAASLAVSMHSAILLDGQFATQDEIVQKLDAIGAMTTVMRHANEVAG